MQRLPAFRWSTQPLTRWCPCNVRICVPSIEACLWLRIPGCAYTVMEMSPPPVEPVLGCLRQIEYLLSTCHLPPSSRGIIQEQNNTCLLCRLQCQWPRAAIRRQAQWSRDPWAPSSTCGQTSPTWRPALSRPCESAGSHTYDWACTTSMGRMCCAMFCVHLAQGCCKRCVGACRSWSERHAHTAEQLRRGSTQELQLPTHFWLSSDCRAPLGAPWCPQPI